MEKESISITANSGSPGTTRVLLEGQLVVRNAKIIKEELSAALAGSQHIIIALRNIIKMDLAVIQLLIALRKAAVNHKKHLSFDVELNDYIKSVMGHSGFSDLFTTNF